MHVIPPPERRVDGPGRRVVVALEADVSHRVVIGALANASPCDLVQPSVSGVPMSN